MGIDDMLDKAKDALAEHSDVLDKAADAIKEHTPDAIDSKIDAAVDKAKDLLDDSQA